MRKSTSLLLLCAALGGCARMGFPFPEPVAGPGYFFPGSNVARVPDEAGRITYEFPRMNGNDFAYAVQAAQRECDPGNKTAHIASMVVTGNDKERATFVCR